MKLQMFWCLIQSSKNNKLPTYSLTVLPKKETAWTSFRNSHSKLFKDSVLLCYGRQLSFLCGSFSFGIRVMEFVKQMISCNPTNNIKDGCSQSPSFRWWTEMVLWLCCSYGNWTASHASEHIQPAFPGLPPHHTTGKEATADLSQGLGHLLICQSHWVTSRLTRETSTDERWSLIQSLHVNS